MKIEIDVPLSEEHGLNLALFFDGMVRKLYLNRHKDKVTLPSVPKLLTLMQGEISEFEEQLEENRLDTNALRELMDTANYAYLIYGALVREGAGGEDQISYYTTIRR